MGKLPLISGCRWNKILTVKHQASKTNPLPREGHTSTQISNHEVFLFGGSYQENKFNDSYIYDLNFKYWYKAENDPTLESPCKRDFHTAVNISNIIYIYIWRLR